MIRTERFFKETRRESRKTRISDFNIKQQEVVSKKQSKKSNDEKNKQHIERT
jgi:hypothetical protein